MVLCLRVHPFAYPLHNIELFHLKLGMYKFVRRWFVDMPTVFHEHFVIVKSQTRRRCGTSGSAVS
jgi:hypothetical protein